MTDEQIKDLIDNGFKRWDSFNSDGVLTCGRYFFAGIDIEDDKNVPEKIKRLKLEKQKLLELEREWQEYLKKNKIKNLII